MLNYKKTMQFILAFCAFLCAIFSLQAQAQSKKELTFTVEAACLSVFSADTKTTEYYDLNLEMALTFAQRAQGLMERDQIGPWQGMLFVYPQAAKRSFWMYKTRIPLDIAFMDAEGFVVDLQTMPPCGAKTPSRCPSYEARAPFVTALEMAAGRFQALGLQQGSQLNLGACPSLEEK